MFCDDAIISIFIMVLCKRGLIERLGGKGPATWMGQDNSLLAPARLDGPAGRQLVGLRCRSLAAIQPPACLPAAVYTQAAIARRRCGWLASALRRKL